MKKEGSKASKDNKQDIQSLTEKRINETKKVAERTKSERRTKVN